MKIEKLFIDEKQKKLVEMQSENRNTNFNDGNKFNNKQQIDWVFFIDLES